MPPPPWKKARLSRIMSDHITSPTHGGSFVVETGFPTSLVDLFVMNSHRMTTETEVQSESESAATTPRSPLDSLRSPLRRSVSEPNKSESKGYFWLWWIFKVFFVVVLALAMATKQLAVGITVSAFSLLLMELFGNYILKPWLYARKRKCSRSIESQSEEHVQIEENDCNADSNEVETPNPNPKPNTHLRLPSGEIRAMKSILSSPRFHKRSVSDDMGTTKDLHAFKSFNLNWFSEESKDNNNNKNSVKKEDADNHHSELDQIPKPLDHDRVPDQIVHKSSSRKIKSKIKKFVKKLKSSKKELTDRRSSSAGPSGESESFYPSIKLNEKNREPLMVKLEDSQVTEMEDKLSTINNDERSCAEGRRRGLRRRKSTYCVAMLAVVLAGLVGGRLCGIAFTVIWCSVMKMIGKEEEVSIGKLSG